jgi:hypothetical protein
LDLKKLICIIGFLQEKSVLDERRLEEPAKLLQLFESPFVNFGMTHVGEGQITLRYV